jgi:copper chaperone CopZ
MKQFSLLAAIAVWTATTSACAEEVTVKNMHLCCRACVSAVEGTLADVSGISKTACDRKAKSTTFTAQDRKASQAAIQALADAGFCGEATVGDEQLEYPKLDVKEGTKSDTVSLTGVHLCCGACVSGAKIAVKDVAGISQVKADQDNGTLELVGKSIDVRTAMEALRKHGFYTTIKKE